DELAARQISRGQQVAVASPAGMEPHEALLLDGAPDDGRGRWLSEGIDFGPHPVSMPMTGLVIAPRHRHRATRQHHPPGHPRSWLSSCYHGLVLERQYLQEHERCQRRHDAGRYGRLAHVTMSRCPSTAYRILKCSTH